MILSYIKNHLFLFLITLLGGHAPLFSSSNISDSASNEITNLFFPVAGMTGLSLFCVFITFFFVSRKYKKRSTKSENSTIEPKIVTEKLVPRESPKNKRALIVDENLENTTLLKENINRLNCIEDDLLLTRKLREKIIPKTLPKVSGFSLHLTNNPLESVGGDYYDFLQNEPDKFGILLCDFSGHGISATVVTAMLKIAFKQQESLADSPAHLITQLNYVMADYLETLSVTATYAFFDASENCLLFTNAGHPPLIIYREKERRSIQHNMETKELGYNTETAFEMKKVSLNTKDRVYMYSDGVLECRNSDGEKFGLDRLLELVREKASTAADKAGGEIIKSLKKWTGNNDWPQDELTIIIIEMN